MYHHIAMPPNNAAIPNLYVTPRMFRFQMGYLKTAGFTVLSIQDLVAAVSAGELTRNLAALTFDDGYMDFYTNAYPVLKQYGYPSTAYIISGLVEKKSDPDFREETAENRLMDWKAIVQVCKNGVQVGSHTKTHPRLTALSENMLIEELTASKKELEERLDQPVDQFCYPFGDCDDRVRNEVEKAGYRYAVVTQRGHVERTSDPYALRRIPVKLITNPFSFLYKIHTNSEKEKGRQLLP